MVAGTLAHAHHVNRNPGLELVRMPFLCIRTARRLSAALSTAMLSTTAIRVIDEDKKEKGGRPAHWTSDKPLWFQNPWPSWRSNGRMDTLRIVRVFWFWSFVTNPQIGRPCHTEQPFLAESRNCWDSCSDTDVGFRGGASTRDKGDMVGPRVLSHRAPVCDFARERREGTVRSRLQRSLLA